MRLTQFLTADEYMKMGDDAVARGFYRDDSRIFTPGMGWPMPWIWDPTGERERLDLHVMHRASHRGRTHHLSVYYWRDWADKRAPLSIVCPNGEVHEIDRRSSNGPGWIVTGEWPHLTVRSSLVVWGYHGWLINGEFSADLEGRGPNGKSRPPPPLRI